MNRSYEWFENNVIYRVPPNFPGRDGAFTGFLQLKRLRGHEPDATSSHYDYFLDLVRGDGDSAESHRQFYDEYNAVLDMPAWVPPGNDQGRLVNGTWDVPPTALWCARTSWPALCADGSEGESWTTSRRRPDLRRSKPAPACPSTPAEALRRGSRPLRLGRRWRNVYPVVREFIAKYDAAPLAAHQTRAQGARACCGEDRDKARRQSLCRPARRARREGLADQIDDALPQTQCTRCGCDCRNYAEAMADGEAGINQCPPGGAEGIVRLAP